MGGVEKNLHSRILAGLATVLANSGSNATPDDLNHLVSRCPPVDLDIPNDTTVYTKSTKTLSMVSRRSQQSLEALVSYAVRAPEERQRLILPRLLAYIRCLPAYDWEETCLVQGLPPPDLVSFSLATGLLDISYQLPDVYDRVTSVLWSYAETLMTLMIDSDVDYLITFVLPSLAGLSRALQLSPFLYGSEQLVTLYNNIQALINDNTLSSIRKAIKICLDSYSPDTYSRRVLERYWQDGVPLSSNRIVLDLLIILRNISARMIANKKPTPEDKKKQYSTYGRKLHFTHDIEEAWSNLMTTTAASSVTRVTKGDLIKCLRNVYVMSLGYFDDLRKHVEADEKDRAPDAYIHEIMETSLHVAALSSVYLQEVDDVLIDRISQCLFHTPSMTDAWIHIASLDAAVLLAVNFPQVNNGIIKTICRFLATPSPVFELEASTTPQKMADVRSISVRQFATVRLAQCIQTKPATQRSHEAIGTLHALLNQITNYHNDRTGTATISGAPSVDQLDEVQRQQVCANVLTAIVDMAAYLKDDFIMAQAFSMLLMRRKQLSTGALSALIAKLVDLALVGSETMFVDIIDLFAVLSRESLFDGNESLYAIAVTSQLNLAQRLSVRPDCYLVFLQRILGLFVDMGNWIQRPTRNVKTNESHIESLGSLLPVLRAILDHNDFMPHHHPAEDLVSLFRDAWFHFLLFGFLTEPKWIRDEWQDMLVIAKKTPTLVLASASKYIISELEGNSVLRNGFKSDRHLGTMRQQLTTILPTVAADIKTLSWSQTCFALVVFHTEKMKSRTGNCSAILSYFENGGIHHGPLANCLRAIAEHVTKTFILDAAAKATAQILGDDDLREQIPHLLKMSCHRLSKVHEPALRMTDRIMTSFPQILADKKLMTLLFELVQLLWQSCEDELDNEYTPRFRYVSERAHVELELCDSFATRRRLFAAIHKHARKWMINTLERAPFEVGSLLQDYLVDNDRYAVSSGSGGSANAGRALALDIGRLVSATLSGTDTEMTKMDLSMFGEPSWFVHGLTTQRFYRGEINALPSLKDAKTGEQDQLSSVMGALEKLMDDVVAGNVPVESSRLQRTLYRAAVFAISTPRVYPSLLRHLVRIPVRVFTPDALDIATSVWNWIMIEKPAVETRLMIEILTMWTWSARHRMGLFSPALNIQHPFATKMSYEPSDKAESERIHKVAALLFTPHIIWIRFLSSTFHVLRHHHKHLVRLFSRHMQETFQASDLMSTHSLSGTCRFQLLRLGLKILQSSHMEAVAEYTFRQCVYDAGLQWFSLSPRWHYGGRKKLALLQHKTLAEFYNALNNDKLNMTHVLSTLPQTHNSNVASGIYMFLQNMTKDDAIRHLNMSNKLLKLFLEHELTRLSVWCNPLGVANQGPSADMQDTTERSMVMDDSWKELIRFAWEVNPQLAVRMDERFTRSIVHEELHRLVANNMLDAVQSAEALVILLGDRIQANAKLDLKYLKYWAPVPAISAAHLLSPEYGRRPVLIQYAMRALQYYPLDTVFFYIPQIVQALRYCKHGYVEQYILQAGQSSQLFAHQIIWNMQANFFIDADKECAKADVLKPRLEKIIEKLVRSFSDDDRVFYDREFAFFGQVTAISGFLKEYIKYGQNDKKPLQKKRLDEELEKIQVDVGVYLPSNPDGRVVDIDRMSGRPLQSHAKAPFMATFQIEKLVERWSIPDDTSEDTVTGESNNSHGTSNTAVMPTGAALTAELQTHRVWQGAIFKVGDDCRQDVLALQLIAVFRMIFSSVGLDLYVLPYRVVATAPGRGVIDVIPNAISRDQLGRERVNSLYDYFVAEYGGPDAIAFQQARINFVQSVAAYSVITYLLQIKDRHNGNIMLDSEGHMVHIDFGFIFDIAPGGISFESSPFKLTAEMVQVMGGGSEEQAFRQFSELAIKAYLACRPHYRVILQLVALMVQSGLPCFQNETIKRMAARFQPGRTERMASNFMIQKIKDSFENQRTVLYDYYQKLTNGIPY